VSRDTDGFGGWVVGALEHEYARNAQPLCCIEYFDFDLCFVYCVSFYLVVLKN
jgi:hypothetical protein